MQFEDFLSRADDETIQTIIGAPTIRLLGLLDSGLTTPTRLRQLMLGMHTAAGLLLNQGYRHLLFDCLRTEDAQRLAMVLRLSAPGDVYQTLKNTRITPDSDREQALFDFFETPLPLRETIDSHFSIEEAASCYPLFVHQREAARKVTAALQQDPYKVLLHMPTGAGKTRTAMNVIADHLRANEPTMVIWLAASEELCEQAAQEFQQAWRHLGNRTVHVHRYWGRYQLDIGSLRDGFFVAGLSKLYQATMKDLQTLNQLAQKCSLVIIDEAHQAVADTYKLLLQSLVVQRRKTGLFGLSATPGRTWSDMDQDQKLADFFARRKVTLQIEGYDNPIEYLEAEQYLAKAEYKTLLYRSGMELSPKDKELLKAALDIPDEILALLADDEQRNLRILAEIERLAREHQRILVFAPSVKNSNLLASVLQARGLTAYSLTGTTPSVERERFIRLFKSEGTEPLILCNYGVLTTGFDAPRTSAAVIARPTRSLVLYSQMVGRALRGVKAGGNATAEIVTVVDPSLYGFGSAAEAFHNWDDVWRKPQ